MNAILWIDELDNIVHSYQWDVDIEHKNPS